MTEQPSPFAIVVPDDQEAGVYGNAVSVWHTATEFTLDFLTLLPGAVTVTHPDGTVGATQRARVVARVKLPPPQIWELMKALETQLTAHEHEQAQRPSGQPFYPPLPPDDRPPEPPAQP